MITWLMMTMAFAQDAPEISRSRGKADGFVVLYPRIVSPDTAPADRSDVAMAVQEMVGQRLINQGWRVDIRPPPERVCPRSGCKAQTIELVLAHAGQGCTLTAVHRLSPQGEGTLVALAGEQSFRKDTVPFRSQPERQLIVKEFVDCQQLADAVSLQALDEVIPKIP